MNLRLTAISATDRSLRLLADTTLQQTTMKRYTLTSLSTILRARDVALSSGCKKEQAVVLAAEHLFNMAETAKILGELSEESRSTLTLLAEGRQSDSQDSRAELASLGLLLIGSTADSEKEDSEKSARMHDLSSIGTKDLYINPVARELLKPDGPVFPVGKARDVSEVDIANVNLLEHDIAIMADMVNEGGVRPLKSGLPGKRFMRRINPSFSVPDELKNIDSLEQSRRLIFVFEMLDLLGVLKRHRDKYILSSQTDSIFGASIPERSKGMYEAWQETSWWHELYQIEGFTLSRKAPEYDHGDGRVDDLPNHEELVAARREICRALGEVGNEGWTVLDDLIEGIKQTSPNLLMRQPQRIYYGRATIYNGVGEPGAEKPGFVWGGAIEREGNWHRVEGAFVREVITTSLHWLGLVDLGKAERDGRTVEVYRLTPMGAWLCGGSKRPKVNQAQVRSLVVQPTFEVVVFPEGQDMSILWRLHRFAEATSTQTVHTYHLNADSVHRAVENGDDADSILKFLELHARTEIPNPVRTALKEWAGRAEQIAVTTDATVLEAESKEEMDEWISGGSGPGLRRISDTLALVTDRSAPLSALPSVDYTDPFGLCLEVDDDLNIRQISTNLHWGVFYLLERLAAPTADPEVWHIDRNTVKAAVKAHLHYDTAAKMLSQATQSPLSRRAQLKLKGLFGRLGPAAAGMALLVVVQDSTTMDAMWSIKDIKHVWLRRLGPTSALVKNGEWETCLRFLDDFGIAVDEAALADSGSRSGDIHSGGETNMPPVQKLPIKAVRAVLKNARNEGEAVRISYRGGSGLFETTIRPLESRNGVISAQCLVAGAVQTFRIDQIAGAKIVPESSGSSD